MKETKEIYLESLYPIFVNQTDSNISIGYASHHNDVVYIPKKEIPKLIEYLQSIEV